MTTCVPAFAVCRLLDDVPTTSLLPKKTPTELGDEISAEEAGAAKDGRDVPRYRTAPRRTLRDDRRPTRKGEHIMQGPLVVVAVSLLAIRGRMRLVPSLWA